MKQRIPFSEYLRIAGVNMSTLLEMLQSPKHYHYRLEHPPEETESMRVGRSAHTAVLEPMEFLREYVLRPDSFPDAKGVMKPYNGNLSSFKEWREAQTRTILTPDDYCVALRIQESVRGHALAGRLLSRGEREVTITWTDAERGIPCKARIDWLTDSIVDLKTTRHVSTYAFAKQAANLKYHTRLAWYQDGVEAALGRRLPVRIISVQNEEPHDVAVYRVPDEALAAGRRQYQGLLDTLALCLETDRWPGIAEEEEVDLILPAYVLGEQSGEGETLTLGGMPMAI